MVVVVRGFQRRDISAWNDAVVTDRHSFAGLLLGNHAGPVPVAGMPEARARLLKGGLLQIDLFANNHEAAKRVIARLSREH